MDPWPSVPADLGSDALAICEAQLAHDLPEGEGDSPLAHSHCSLEATTKKLALELIQK